MTPSPPAVLERTYSGPEGIGGWLLLPLLGLIVTPVRVGYAMYRDIIPAFAPEVWDALTTPGSPDYHPAWSGLLWFEALGNAFIILLALAALYHFVTRSRRTPILYIALLAFTLLFITGDWLLAEQIPFVAGEPDEAANRELVNSAVRAAIWIPYFIFSSRVRNTFVR